MYGFTNNFISIKIDNIFLITLVIIIHVDAIILFSSGVTNGMINMLNGFVLNLIWLRLTEYDTISGSTQTV